MKGFFFQQTKNKEPYKIKDTCELCGLYKTCSNSKLSVFGEGHKKILIIAEAPGEKETNESQLTGEAGKILRNVLSSYGVDIEYDCWKTNALRCHPVKGKISTNQLNLCHKYLGETLEKLKPEKIIILGKAALQSFLLSRASVSSIDKWVGACIPDQKYKCWVFPTYHPQYLNYNSDNPILKKTFEQHIKTAIEWDKIFTKVDPKIKIIKSPEEAIQFMNTYKGKYGAIDFETTGKKPYKEGHEIICISIAGKEGAVAFPIFKHHAGFDISLQAFLQGPVKKIGRNIKYETVWSKKILGYDIKNWYSDGMLDAHINDNRSGVTGLKFQTYINFGIIGYDKPMEKFISSEGNNINRMKEAPLDEVLKYCALDSWFTYYLFRKNPKRTKAKDFFLQGQLALSEVEYNGLHIDTNYYLEQMDSLQEQMGKIKNRILKSPEVDLWNEKFSEEFNFNSPKHLKTLLFDILNIKSEKQTVKGSMSVDAEVLENINLPLTKRIIKYKKLYKLRNTYISNFLTETDSNFMHPTFNLNTVVSFRSSCSNPNFQNIPSRDSLAQEITRSGITPRPGNQLLEVDYSAIEVRISSCYHKDPEMIKYIQNPESDMHRDMAIEIFKHEDITKQERYLTKNNFVFPQFYGDYYVNCAKNIWKNGKEFVPFNSYFAFEKHMKQVEYKFWNEKFKIYNQWKEETWEEYQKTGKIDLHTGFTCKGIYRKNEVLNLPIQGSAFHCLLWSLIQLQKYLSDNKMKSLIVGQIHDSMIIDVVPSEVEQLKIILPKIMCEDIREYWPWIIVPLQIEMELTEIDQSWNTKQKENI